MSPPTKRTILALFRSSVMPRAYRTASYKTGQQMILVLVDGSSIYAQLPASYVAKILDIQKLITKLVVHSKFTITTKFDLHQIRQNQSGYICKW